MIIFPQGIEVSETDALCLKNDILGIEEWLSAALAGKISSCKDRLFREWHPRLLRDPDVNQIPGEERELVDFITSRSDYQNRSDRESMSVDE